MNFDLLVNDFLSELSCKCDKVLNELRWCVGFANCYLFQMMSVVVRSVQSVDAPFISGVIGSILSLLAMKGGIAELEESI